ncbi:MAG TPA: 5-(carboxyamino)imidazole ribonucleotide mutase [Vicinamibacteria bacterium]|jgi:phosphoribosylaminoimidazole carboxylase PurE protein
MRARGAARRNGRTAGAPVVGIVMGSGSDLPTMSECGRVLESYGVPFEARVLSAHRTPDEAARFAREAEGRGLKVIVAGAGGAAHLAGAMAAHSTIPVIGVPLDSSPLRGFDALLSTVQMPPGVPVATVGVGSMGAKNAGHLAVAILAVGDDRLRTRLRERRRQMAAQVLAESAVMTPAPQKTGKAG